MRQDSTYSVQSDFSKNGANTPSGPHPLSNALYADSSPTLHESGSHSSDGYKKGDSEKSRLQNEVPRESGFKRFGGAFVAGKRSSDEYTTVKRTRVGHLDGLKFIAACIVLNATFFDAVIEDDVSAGISLALCHP